ncbi:MAG: hypothetical protein VW683_04520 [Betaproteobacteria bacterium]
MATFSNADYAGPFSSKYEEDEALQGNRGNQAAHAAAQAVHSRGLRNIDIANRPRDNKRTPQTDTSIYGTNENPIMRMLGMKNAAQYPDPTKNPMYNYRMQPRQTPSLAEIGPPRQRGMAGSGGFFPMLAGVGPDGTATGIQQMGNNFAGQREAFGMGLGNLASGGAFTSDPNVKIQKFMDQGFSPDQAQRYVQATENTAARLKQDQFLYGDRVNERGGTQATQATAATGEADPTADPNYIPPHLRYLMEQQQPVTTMNMGGLMALRPYMQQQQYNMGKQLAMRDMGVSV